MSDGRDVLLTGEGERGGGGDDGEDEERAGREGLLAMWCVRRGEMGHSGRWVMVVMTGFVVVVVMAPLIWRKVRMSW